MAKEHNHLKAEKSPYLLQHAGNPVDWYPWSKEAFEKAKRHNLPVFLSIGYSTCHWCHVMAHESFEHPEVARLMNETFVSIKVDREERPDIDNVYMNVCQMMTGSGGWPLTIIMTPDKEPFFAATYIPRESRYGRVGMLDLIPRVKEIWMTRQAEAVVSAARVTEAIRRAASEEAGENLSESLLDIACRQLLERFDEHNGGFSAAPKFPTPHNLLLLLRNWKRASDENALHAVEKTLQAMRCGGIYDQIGFGFHRYSTDASWLVPHFEKMLYDQALLAVAYLEAYQATGNEDYANTAREIFEYVTRDMSSPGGAFYSAEDADSEGEEGKFYLWTRAEIEEELPREQAELAAKLFNIDNDGNYEEEATGEKTGRNIPHLTGPLEYYAGELGMDAAALRVSLENIRETLFIHRNQRVHPQKDDKILTDWNGLMIAALAKGAQVLNEPRYADAAKRAADFIVNNLRDTEERLLHRYRDGEAALAAHIDDYAFLIHGLIELHEATFEAKYLKNALDLNEALIRHFWDDENGGFYFTADDGEPLLLRRKEIYDGAVPSGNSVAMLNLLRLGRITANTDYEEKADRLGRAFFTQVSQSPSAFTQLMVAADFATGPAYEVVITGRLQDDDTKNMLAAIRKMFVPNKVFIFRPSGQDSPEIDEIAGFIKDYTDIDGRATAYVCRSRVCQLPTNDISQLKELLGSKEA